MPNATDKEKIMEVILDHNECPLCGYGAWWGTCDPATGKRHNDEMRANRLANKILRALAALRAANAKEKTNDRT